MAEHLLVPLGWIVAGVVVRRIMDRVWPERPPVAATAQSMVKAAGSAAVAEFRAARDLASSSGEEGGASGGVVEASGEVAV